jgi:hypothetical protein
MIKEMLDLETALLYDADFDGILEASGWEVVYDARKTGKERYNNLIKEWC